MTAPISGSDAKARPLEKQVGGFRTPSAKDSTLLAPDPIAPATTACADDLGYGLTNTSDGRRFVLDGHETSNREQKAINLDAQYRSTIQNLIALNVQLRVTLDGQRSISDDLQNVLHSTDVATLSLDPDLKILFFTPATRSLFNIIPGDIGRPLADLRSLSADDRLATDSQAVLEGSMPIEREIEVPGGSWFLRRILPLYGHDDEIDGVVITFTDVTERKHAAKALQATKREAQLANVAKSRFLAAASHDLRQPLQSLTLLQALLAQAVEGDRAPKLVERLGQTLDAMTGMLDVLLDINQIEAGVVQPEPTEFAIVNLFDRLRDEFSYQAQSQRLDLRILRCGLNVHSDPRLLEQMVRNLLANAMKYTKAGRIVLGCRRAKGQIRIEIWDSGIGIADTELRPIFDEFHQVDNAAREGSKGLGLGLSIVQRLGALLDHDIGVRSQLGKGSVFSIVVPRAAKDSAKILEPAQSLGASVAPAGLIMVVEDDPEIRDLLELLLTAEGHSVQKAANGKAAVALVTKSAIRPDVVLADYNLPGAVDGLCVLADIGEVLNRPMAGIILTGDISKATQTKIAAACCVQLSKPVKSRELIAAVDRLLSREVRPANRTYPDQAEVRDAVIFVVDDDTNVRESVRDVLEADGHLVEDFPDAEAFLTAYRPGREGCLLLDANLPGIRGIDLLSRLRGTRDPMPTIVMTGSSDVAMAVDAMKAGACDFIEKPVCRVALLASIAQALAQSHNIGIVQALQESAARHVAALTPRQHQVMDLVLAGHPSKNIATDLGISQRTVENHRASVMHKMGAKSLPDLARQALAAEKRSV